MKDDPFFSLCRENLEERERVEEAKKKPPSERTEADWTLIQYSPFGTGQGCGCKV